MKVLFAKLVSFESKRKRFILIFSPVLKKFLLSLHEMYFHVTEKQVKWFLFSVAVLIWWSTLFCYWERAQWHFSFSIFGVPAVNQALWKWGVFRVLIWANDGPFLPPRCLVRLLVLLRTKGKQWGKTQRRLCSTLHLWRFGVGLELGTVSSSYSATENILGKSLFPYYLIFDMDKAFLLQAISLLLWEEKKSIGKRT